MGRSVFCRVSGYLRDDWEGRIAASACWEKLSEQVEIKLSSPIDTVPDSPLRSLNNGVLTPHIGWTVEEVFEEFAQIACTQLLQYLQGELIDKR